MTSEDAARRFVDFAVRLKRIFRAELGKADGCLTEERFRSLMYLAEVSGAALSDLSERIRISPSSLCIMLGKLEEEGLVCRERDSVDRRRVAYRITSEGRAALEADRSRRLAALSGRFAPLGEGELKRLVDAMGEIEGLLGGPEG